MTTRALNQRTAAVVDPILSPRPWLQKLDLHF